MEPYVVTVGAINVDLCGRSSAKIVPCDSNPGRFSTDIGGVGFNIARDISTLGVKSVMLTAVGDDLWSDAVSENAKRYNVDISLARRVPGARSSVYLLILDSDGRMNCGINDMEAVESITPEYVRENASVISEAAVVVVEANLKAETIAEVVKHAKGPVFADPVSSVKAHALIPSLRRIDTIKPNLSEAQVLTGCKGKTECAKKLQALGCKNVFISLGAKGVYALCGGRELALSAPSLDSINVNGAGDAFTAALVWSRIKSLPPEKTALAATAATKHILMCPSTVSVGLTEELLWKAIE